jgi:hypothetical protein
MYWLYRLFRLFRLNRIQRLHVTEWNLRWTVDTIASSGLPAAMKHLQHFDGKRKPRHCAGRTRLTAWRSSIALAAWVLSVAWMNVPAQAEDACPRLPCWRCLPGYPARVGIVSAPSNTRHYGGYYVGGGTIFRGGQPRYENEGTWGWDYGGLLNRKWVGLDWSHGRRYQAGGGTYRTAGPAFHASQ